MQCWPSSSPPSSKNRSPKHHNEWSGLFSSQWSPTFVKLTPAIFRGPNFQCLPFLQLHQRCGSTYFYQVIHLHLHLSSSYFHLNTFYEFHSRNYPPFLSDHQVHEQMTADLLRQRMIVINAPFDLNFDDPCLHQQPPRILHQAEKISQKQSSHP